MEDIKYWIGYYVDEFSTREDIKPYLDFESGLTQGILSWNKSCEFESRVDTNREIEIVGKQAKKFFDKTGWISKSIIAAMICQSF